MAAGPHNELWVQRQLDLASLNAKRNKMMTCKPSRVKKWHSDGRNFEKESDHNVESSSRDIVFIQDHLTKAKPLQNVLPARLKQAVTSPNTSPKQVPTAPSAQPAVSADQRINSVFAQWSVNAEQFERKMRNLLTKSREDAAQSLKGLIFW